MSTYRLLFRPYAKKQLQSLPKNTQKRIDIALLSLKTNPRPSGVKKLRGKGNEWRIRVGKYRIVYEIYDEKLVIRVIEIDHRKNVY